MAVTDEFPSVAVDDGLELIFVILDQVGLLYDIRNRVCNAEIICEIYRKDVSYNFCWC